MLILSSPDQNFHRLYPPRSGLGSQILVKLPGGINPYQAELLHHKGIQLSKSRASFLTDWTTKNQRGSGSPDPLKTRGTLAAMKRRYPEMNFFPCSNSSTRITQSPSTHRRLSAGFGGAA